MQIDGEKREKKQKNFLLKVVSSLNATLRTMRQPRHKNYHHEEKEKLSQRTKLNR
jgi:hypothetical protein